MELAEPPSQQTVLCSLAIEGPALWDGAELPRGSPNSAGLELLLQPCSWTSTKEPSDWSGRNCGDVCWLLLEECSEVESLEERIDTVAVTREACLFWRAEMRCSAHVGEELALLQPKHKLQMADSGLLFPAPSLAWLKLWSQWPCSLYCCHWAVL